MPDKIKIDPAHPVGSLTAGPQQFTMAADTNHGKESIHALINNDIAMMARNGVKHIMIEYTAPPVDEIEQKYPAIAAGKTLREKMKILDDLSDTASAEDYKLIIEAKLDLRVHQMLEDIYATPPRMTDDEIREVAKGFVSSKAEDPQKSSENFAELLIRTRNAGIQVHFTGDRSESTRKAVYDAKMALAEFTAANQKYADNYENSRTVIGFKIPDAEMVAQIRYMQKAAELTRKLNDAEEAHSATRDAPEAEQRRVDRMIALAKGEKSVIVWGSAHAYKANDFNERIDARLAEQAQKSGQPPPANTKVIELYDSRIDRDNIGPSPLQVDEPDARYYIQEGEIEITPSGADALEMSPLKIPAPKTTPSAAGLGR